MSNTNTTFTHILNHIPNALYINAQFNNNDIPITIDTGANICCIRHTLVPKDQIINKVINIKLTGPNNNPLTLIGSTEINIEINSIKFKILTYIIQDLSCAFIIGNNFLSKNHAIIDFKGKTITLNNKLVINAYTNITDSKINLIKEKRLNIFELSNDYSIAHCISADLKMSQGLAFDIKNIYGDSTNTLSNLNPQIGDVLPTRINNKLIYHLITKEKFYQKPTIDSIKLVLANLKKCMILNKNFNLSIPKLASGLDRCNWTIIKQLIYSEFQNTDIEIIICHIDDSEIINNWKTNEHEKLTQVVRNLNNNCTKPTNTLEYNNFTETTNTLENKKDIKPTNTLEHKNDIKPTNILEFKNIKAYTIFNNYKPGENVIGDDNCGIYAICNALNDGDNKITSISNILELLTLNKLPNYWWADDELASIANHYGFDTYIYDDTTKNGIVYAKENDNRPAIVLYNVSSNTHWIPGTKSTKPSTKIPIKYSYTMNTITIDEIIQKIHNNKTHETAHKKISQVKEGILINLSPQTDLLQSKQKSINQLIDQNNNINTHNNSISNTIKNELIYNKINAFNNNTKTIDKEINNIHNNNIVINKETIKDYEGTLINISANLNLIEHKQVTELIKEYLHLFTTDTSKVKPANIEPCQIRMKPNYKDPKFNAPHRISPQQRDELKIQLDKLLDADIIRPIISKFAAPAFLVKKKEKGSYRLVVSYKELNERVETDQYPIPRTTDLLRALEGSQYFTSLDLNSGFFQLPIQFDDQYKLAFTSVLGLMTFTRLPQGFKNSSAIFQRILNESFSPLLYKSLIIYIDDLASYGKNFKQSLENLRNAFIIMDKMNFSLKTNKCFFFNDKIELLGHNISINGITPLNRNIKAITEFKQPKTQKDVRSFIGMCSYYRKHIKDFAKISHPLTELIKGDIKLIKWEEEQKQSFSLLKELLTSEPLLKHFDDDKEVFLTIDASITGLGACLEQPNNNNILHPIGYASRKILNNEKTYSSTTLELLGLVFGITYFREYLWGRQFTVFCDNISLQYYKNLKIPSARIARLTLKLLDFTFDIIYKKGKENRVADALSRNSINIVTDDNDNYEIDKLINFDIKTLQSNDQFCTDIIKAINKTDNKTNKNIQRKSRQFAIINDVLYNKHFTPPNTIKHLLVVPIKLTNELLKSYHESPIGGHTGITRTIHKLQNKYYWTTLSKDTTQFIKTCHQCQINKKLPGKPIGQLQPIPISNRPMDRLVFDYLGPLPSSNKKKYVLVAACSNTKYIFTKAVESATAESTVKFLIQIVSQWGSFRQFSSDRGTHFKNKLIEEVTQNLGIKQILSTAYSPETQGFVERVNGVLCSSLKNYINDDNQQRWSYFLPYITLAYNATPQTSTNYSPFFLMHGFEPYFPIDIKLIPEGIPYDIQKSLKELNDIRNKIPQIIEKAQINQKKYYDKSHRIISFKPGDQVLVKFPFLQAGKSPKLAQKYRGPFKIIKKITDLNYKVQLILNKKLTEDTIHVRRIKPYYHR